MRHYDKLKQAADGEHASSVDSKDVVIFTHYLVLISESIVCNSSKILFKVWLFTLFQLFSKLNR